MADPWTDSIVENQVETDTNNTCVQLPLTEFEDNFVEKGSEDSVAQELPDSKEYLKNLESKLAKIKKNADSLAQLTARKELCMERLLRGSIDLQTFTDFDASVGESLDFTKAREILHHIIPQQPLNPGELVSIIKYDQFEANENESENQDQSDRESR